ncbi:MAG: methyl-accepting chemotaxis protein, partial [Immundisolibacter sp.]|uniref:methyl-accepting chemotaxis protein n=1 Tax=Immundisolibacter sp. TaxID=1934948 RepID=UPI003EDFC4F8
GPQLRHAGDDDPIFGPQLSIRTLFFHGSTLLRVRCCTSDLKPPIRGPWEQYQSRPKALKDETDLANDVAQVLAQANQSVESLVQILERRNAEELETYARTRMQQELGPAVEALSMLIDFQREQAATLYARNAAMYQTSRLVTGTLMLATLVIGGWGVFTTVGGVSLPLARITSAMRAVAKGEIDGAAVDLDRRDEIGSLARALEVFKENRRQAEMLQNEQQIEQAGKEQRRVAIEGFISEFDTSLAQALNTLNSSAEELRATAQSMSQTAEFTDLRAATVAAASEQATANVKTLAAAAEQLATSIAEIGRHGSHSAEIATRALESAEVTNAKVQSLADAAGKIGDVVTLINGIASQTNLLALNATIEAARAGDAGKGFAVVASEVKSLAKQTAEATEEVASQIAAIQAATQEAISSIQGIGSTIRELNDTANVISRQVKEQGQATQDIARNIAQTAAGTQEVSQNITEVSSAAAETGAAAGQLLGSADELARQGTTLRDEVNRFLGELRAA